MPVDDKGEVSYYSQEVVVLVDDYFDLEPVTPRNTITIDFSRLLKGPTRPPNPTPYSQDSKYYASGISTKKLDFTYCS